MTCLLQEAHGQHHLPEKQFQLINTFAQNYEYTVTLLNVGNFSCNVIHRLD